jgi:CBS domain containing-hemolysin-like protein
MKANNRWWLLAATPAMLLLGRSAFAEGAELPTLSGLLLPTLIIALLLILNGLFVAGEFAFIGSRTTRLETLLEEGEPVAGKVLADLSSTARQDQYIATTQLGITLASLGLGMYGEPAIAHFIEPYLGQLAHSITGNEVVPDAILHTIGYIISLSLLTYLHVVVGEMVPKSLALANPEKTVISINGAMSLVRLVFLLPVRLLNAIGNYFLHLIRVPPVEGHAQLYAPEEIEQLVSESAEGGLFRETEEEMLRKIFDFSERQVKQVMTPRRKIQAIPVTASLDEILNVTTRSKHSRFPVYEGDLDHIIGILHLKDLVRQQINASSRAFDPRLLIKTIPVVPESYPVEQLLAAFRSRRLHMAVVLDEYGGTAGIVSLEDLVEEIVGEIRDEFDYERDPLIEVSPGVLEVAGNYLIDELREHLFPGEEEDLPDVETVGGLIVSWLGRPPKVNDTHTYKDITYTVLAIDGLAVARARVEFPIPKTEKK